MVSREPICAAISDTPAFSFGMDDAVPGIRTFAPHSPVGRHAPARPLRAHGPRKTFLLRRELEPPVSPPPLHPEAPRGPRPPTGLSTGMELGKRRRSRMGNRAIITTQERKIRLYPHWNGGRDTVEPLLRYCELQGYRPPSSDSYGWARICQVVGNFFGGTLSVGIGPYTDDAGMDPGATASTSSRAGGLPNALRRSTARTGSPSVSAAWSFPGRIPPSARPWACLRGGAARSAA